eukprot:1051514-Amphidinium_carterae.1
MEVFQVKTQGTLSNISTPPGLILLDAGHLDGSGGAGVASVGPSPCVIALLAPILRAPGNKANLVTI